MARAARLLGKGAAVEALYLLRVPGRLALWSGNGDRSLEEAEARGRSVLEVARLQARARHLKVRVQLVRTRNPGKTIVDVARERRSDLIYLTTDHAPPSARGLGQTIRYVLQHRPCRVVIEHDPAHTAGPDPEPAEANSVRSEPVFTTQRG
jgi:nucleotide-binding universal stress UspA family protein